jgi:hypothetical protein
MNALRDMIAREWLMVGGMVIVACGLLVLIVFGK